MVSAFPLFFEANDFFIDEKVNFFKFENAYKVYDDNGLQVGNIVQQVSGWHKFLRIISSLKAMMPFTMYIQDMQGQKLVKIHRGWTFWLSKIQITDEQTGATLGFIRQKFRFLKPRFFILGADEQQIGLISGDWKAWNFRIEDAGGQPIGTITKKWAGMMKEVFTTADKYLVHIEPAVAEDERKIAIVSAAITIDMVLKESKG